MFLRIEKHPCVFGSTSYYVGDYYEASDALIAQLRAQGDIDNGMFTVHETNPNAPKKPASKKAPSTKGRSRKKST